MAGDSVATPSPPFPLPKRSSASRFSRTVCLHDWWLIRAKEYFEGKALAVAGFTSREKQAVRVFSSAPIIRRYDVFTLEAADGVCVVIKGFINKLHTNENGFCSDVFNHFLFGFPPYWEECVVNCSIGGCGSGFISSGNCTSNKLTTNSGTKDSNPTVMPSFSQEVTPKKYDDIITGEVHVNSQNIMEHEPNKNLEEKITKCESFKNSVPNKSSIQAGKDRSSQNISRKKANTPVKSSIKLGATQRKNDRTIAAGEMNSGAHQRHLSAKNIKEILKYDTEKRRGKNVVSPETLSFKRSRSGRLLVPTLDFWRNQVAIYDTDRHITGIQEDLNIIKQCRGSRSERKQTRRLLR